jgi:hypothetical protein
MTWPPVLPVIAPAADGFQVRVDARDEQIPDIFAPAPGAGARVGTTAGELFLGLVPLAHKAGS